MFVVTKDDISNPSGRISKVSTFGGEVTEMIEQALGKSAIELYQEACETILSRQIGKNTASSDLAKLKILTTEEYEISNGFLSFHLISNLRELRGLLNSVKNMQIQI